MSASFYLRPRFFPFFSRVYAYSLNKFTANEIMKLRKRNQHRERDMRENNKVLEKKSFLAFFFFIFTLSRFNSNQIKLTKSLIKVNAHWSLSYIYFLSHTHTTYTIAHTH